MTYSHQIVCLANSRKLSARCLAGKIWGGERHGEWIRPIGTGEHGAVTEYDREYEDGSRASIPDVIEISFDRQQQDGFQRENHHIDKTTYWEKLGEATVDQIAGLVDTPPSLWENHHHSTSGTNDQVPEAGLTQLRQSLFLIRPENISIIVGAEGLRFGNSKKTVRARFTYNRIIYALKVTDPAIEEEYKARGDGTYNPTDMSLFTISLGEVFNGNAYKLVAAVFRG